MTKGGKRHCRASCNRVKIRDAAKAVEAASAILKRKDIQIQAANLVQDAERAIAKANPPMSKSESGALGGKSNSKHSVSEGVLKSKVVSEMRQAHDNITDEEFEAAKQEATDNQEPLTRSYLKGKSAEKKQGGTCVSGRVCLK